MKGLQEESAADASTPTEIWTDMSDADHTLCRDGGRSAKAAVCGKRRVADGQPFEEGSHRKLEKASQKEKLVDDELTPTFDCYDELREEGGLRYREFLRDWEREIGRRQDQEEFDLFCYEDQDGEVLEMCGASRKGVGSEERATSLSGIPGQSGTDSTMPEAAGLSRVKKERSLQGERRCRRVSYVTPEGRKEATEVRFLLIDAEKATHLYTWSPSYDLKNVDVIKMVGRRFEGAKLRHHLWRTIKVN